MRKDKVQQITKVIWSAAAAIAFYLKVLDDEGMLLFSV